ncbi:putative type IX sorting system protein PorV2 [Aureibaculum conchae]|uniref:putative type IX sorting system protein PorV2 n=1 Tax=Aureibaculum sp. 2308TA14-22 TaxID=3108392 RepID=UPI0033926D55
MKKILVLILFLAQTTYGQTIRNFSNEFLNIGVDAAAFGMGKAVTAFSNDVNAIYWNPAGLVGLKDYQGSLMHAEYFQGIANYDYVGFAKPINNESTVAIAIMRFGVDDILNTTQLIQDGQINYDRVSLFSAADWAVNVAYAKKLITKDLNVGVNAKIVRRKIGGFATSIGFGLDAGLQFKRNNWQFGLMLRDITTTFNAWSFDDDELNNILEIYNNLNQSILNDGNPDNDDEIIPTVTPEKIELTKPKAQLGVARKFKVARDFNLLTALDLNMRFAKTNDVVSSSVVSLSPSFGFQLDYINLVYLRGGVNNFQNETDFDNNKSLTLEPNFGVGFNYKGISVDYALTNIGGASGSLFSNVFSIKVDISAFRPVTLE